MEHRALYKSYPPLHHFNYFNYNGKCCNVHRILETIRMFPPGSSHMMCSILKGGSNSWKIFMQRVYSAVKESGAALQSGQYRKIRLHNKYYKYYNCIYKYLSQENLLSRNQKISQLIYLSGAGLNVLTRALRLFR